MSLSHGDDQAACSLRQFGTELDNLLYFHLIMLMSYPVTDSQWCFVAILKLLRVEQKLAKKGTAGGKSFRWTSSASGCSGAACLGKRAVGRLST